MRQCHPFEDLPKSSSVVVFRTCQVPATRCDALLAACVTVDRFVKTADLWDPSADKVSAVRCGPLPRMALDPLTNSRD